MKQVRLHNLNGHAFSFTPADAVEFDVTRANPGTRKWLAPNGVLEDVPNPAQVKIAAGPGAPLIVYPGDVVVLPDQVDCFEPLIASGEAEEEIPF